MIFMKDAEEKEISLQSGKFIGELQQVLIDALNKRVDEIFDAEHKERAYWRFNITLVMEEMESGFAKVLRTTTIESKDAQ
jgi:sporulation protein YlmC with PRC-barrel domain